MENTTLRIRRAQTWDTIIIDENSPRRTYNTIDDVRVYDVPAGITALINERKCKIDLLIRGEPDCVFDIITPPRSYRRIIKRKPVNFYSAQV
jgi:hypothetical protein